MLTLDGDILVCQNDGDYVAACINGGIFEMNAFEYLSNNCENLMQVYYDCTDHDDNDIFFDGTWLLNNFSTYFIKHLLITYGYQITLLDFERNYDV